MSLSSRNSDLTQGNITKHLIRLVLPLIAGNILQQLYNTVDAFVVARYAGIAEFAAIGVAGAVMNLFLFAAREEGVFVGWISLVYIPKLGPWKGRGHVYVDELWVEPGHRRKGLAVALMAKADELCAALDATGTRLYVNVNNPGAQSLYEKCGFAENGRALFMEKRL